MIFRSSDRSSRTKPTPIRISDSRQDLTLFLTGERDLKNTFAAIPGVLFALVLLAACGGGGGGSGGTTPPVTVAPPAVILPTTIPSVAAYLAPLVCPDGGLAVIEGCANPTPLLGSAALQFRRYDQSRSPTQIEDAWQLDDGSGYSNDFSYPPNGPFVPANGDGGDVLVTDGHTVRISYTQNGCAVGPGCPTGTIAGWWVGPLCGGTGWLEFDDQAPIDGSWKSRVATLAGSVVSASDCSQPLNSAYTQWRGDTLPIVLTVNGTPRSITGQVVVSEHYGGATAQTATSMERVIMFAEFGRLSWQSWTTTPATPPQGCQSFGAWSQPPGPGVHERSALHDVDHRTDTNAA